MKEKIESLIKAYQEHAEWSKEMAKENAGMCEYDVALKHSIREKVYAQICGDLQKILNETE